MSYEKELEKIKEKQKFYQNKLDKLNKVMESLEKEIKEKKLTNIIPTSFKSDHMNYQSDQNSIISGDLYLGHLPKGTNFTLECPPEYEGKLSGNFATCSLSKERLAKQKELEKIKGMLMKYSKKLYELDKRERFILNLP